MNYLAEPLTKEEIEERDYQISEVIPVYLGELISLDHEALLDLFSERTTGTLMLMDISHIVVGIEETKNPMGHKILIEVSGYLDADDFD